jgi:hypothetical protein
MDRKEQTGKDQTTKIYLTEDSTLQTPEEDRHDKSQDPSKNDTLEPSNDDLHETNRDRAANRSAGSGGDI